jgi:uncharacterized phage protein (TIGR02218 family)
MTYSTLDVSQQASAPVLLYQFVRGSTTWRYVALPAEFTALGYAWTPEVINGGNVASSGDVPKDTVSITLPITNAMAAAFLAYAPDEVTTVTIWRTHYDDPTNGLVIWKGRVLTVSTTVATVTLTCEPVFVSLRRMGLRQTYQRACRHMLFGPGCNVDPDAWELEVTVEGVSANVVTIAETLPDGYVGGTLKASDGTIRMIVAQNAKVLTLMRPVAQLATDFAAHPGGFAALVYLGCDKSTSTCRDTFENLGNFGGFPGITGYNPMSGTSNVW